MNATGLHVLELYSTHLAVNGDMGNTMVLERRARLAGLDVRVTRYGPGDDLPSEVDLITMGSGPSSAVRAIADDIGRSAGIVRAWIDDGVPALFVGAGYQLAGTEVTGLTAEPIGGLGVFDLTTDAAETRQVTAEFLVDSDWGRLVGIENHGSRTRLSPTQKPLGVALTGRGNGDGGAAGGEGSTEGARTREALGTHMHGPILAMNPVLADHLLLAAATRANLEYVTGAEHCRLDELAAATRALLDHRDGASAERPAS